VRRTRECWVWLVAAGLALAGAGCVHAPWAPWLPAPRELNRFPYGAAADLRLRGWRNPPVRGELIALDRDTVFVLTAAGLVGTPCRSVRRLMLYADRNSQLNTPLLNFGPRSPRESRPLPESWENIRPFARFPTGLPASIARESLRMPPWP